MTHTAPLSEPMTLRRLLTYSAPTAALLVAAVPVALAMRHLRAAFDRSFTLSLHGLDADADAWMRELEER